MEENTKHTLENLISSLKTLEGFNESQLEKIKFPEPTKKRIKRLMKRVGAALVGTDYQEKEIFNCLNYNRGRLSFYIHQDKTISFRHAEGAKSFRASIYEEGTILGDSARKIAQMNDVKFSIYPYSGWPEKYVYQKDLSKITNPDEAVNALKSTLIAETRLLKIKNKEVERLLYLKLNGNQE